MTVPEIGGPIILAGRHRGAGIGPFRAAGRIRPSSAIACHAALSRSLRLNGAITAIGRPRSVRTTSRPARTARIALEKC